MSKDNVIKFPIEYVLKKKAEEDLDKLRRLAAKKQALKIDNVCRDVAEQLYEVLNELQFTSPDEDFYKDFTYTIEAFRSMLLRASMIRHPIQEQSDKLMIKKSTVSRVPVDLDDDDEPDPPTGA